jgi:tetratricopeptide (TPR) repeat protein
MIKRITLSLMLACLAAGVLSAAPGKATLTEGKTSMLTYGFSDPNPVANPDLLQYPYFRFDGYESVGKNKEWKTVVLENEWISVTVFPEVGGKVWGAIDKTRGLEFVYYNHVVKFRDIAMRGAWTSGGIEFNFGIIGHIPSTATPVDYITRENPDGSVSCIIASYELLTRTWWTVEINVPADKAYFTTKADYINTSSLAQPYYNWSNAAFKAGGNLQLCMPGDRYIGHPGDPHAYPRDPKGRDLSWFSQNAFGADKSYHIIGEYAEYFGAYWHDDNFGYAHVARPDEKLGRKFFCWSQARQGGIWEDLLTDKDGQYVEMQAGRMFNQPSQIESINTPFKHNSIAPATEDDWTEYWFPVENIGAFQVASRFGALSLERTDGETAIVKISPVCGGTKRVTITCDGKELFSDNVAFSVLKPWEHTVVGVSQGPVKVTVGDDDLVYDENPTSRRTNRPDTMPEDFDWNTAYGHCLRADQLMNVNHFEQARDEYLKSLAIDKWNAPALRGMASFSLHCGMYDEAFDYAQKALRINTYDGEANYLYGLAARALGKSVETKDGFSLATFTSAWQEAAYVELARTALADGNWDLALTYSSKSPSPMATVTRLAALRHKGEKGTRGMILDLESTMLPLFPYFNFENSLLKGDPKSFLGTLKCELPQETLLEMAIWYLDSGLDEEAETLCSMTSYPTAKYLRAYILDKKGDSEGAYALLKEADASSPEFVFPFRPEMIKVFDWAEAQIKEPGRTNDWKHDYYKALILWRNARKDEALRLLNGCGDLPDFNPFYLTRAKLRGGEARLEDLKKAESISQDWRTGKALVDYYRNNSEWKEALDAGERYFKKYPDKFEFGLAYADALCGAKQYTKSLKVLSKLKVMPMEGARRGHEIYRKACLGKARDELKAGNYAACIKSVEASNIWDENLGVGKPYDELIDLSEENAIIKEATEKLHRKK